MEVTEDDLLKLVAEGVPESVQLEYKRSDALGKTPALLTELSRDVSAFANSAGGRLIYGVVEQDRVPVGLDGGVDGDLLNREWLEQVLLSRIQPRVQNVTITPVSLSSGGQAYVLDIPQATSFAPHQADDKKYYRRRNFKREPMEDYEIRDVMRRALTPTPVIFLHVGERTPRPNGGFDLQIIACVTNLSAEPAIYTAVTLLIDGNLMGDPRMDSSLSEQGAMKFEASGDRYTATMYTLNMMPPQHMPVFKEKIWRIATLTILMPPVAKYYLGYEVSCPGYSKMSGGVFGFDGSKFNHLEGDADLFQAPASLKATGQLHI